MTDFSPFPLAVAFSNDESVTVSFANPQKVKTIPAWGKHCWWTDPPPPECEPNLCQLNPQVCGKLPGGIASLQAALTPRSGATGKVVEGTDLTDFPPHLLPLIKTVNDIAQNSGIDLSNDELSGVTITFHK